MLIDDYSVGQKNQVRSVENKMIKPDFSGKVITVFGGTGFLGRYIVAELAKAGATFKIVTRHTQSAYFLRTYGKLSLFIHLMHPWKTSSAS